MYTTDPEEKKIKDCAQFDIPEDEDRRNMCFAASLSLSSALFGGNQISVRSCDSKEWNMFLSHSPNKNLIHRCRGRPRHGRGEMGRAEMRMRRRMMRPRLEEEDFDLDLDESDDDSLGEPFRHNFRPPMRPRPRPRPRI